MKKKLTIKQRIKACFILLVMCCFLSCEEETVTTVDYICIKDHTEIDSTPMFRKRNGEQTYQIYVHKVCDEQILDTFEVTRTKMWFGL